MFRWIALISAVVFVLAFAGIILSSQQPIDPAPQQSTEKNQEENATKKNEIGLFDRWFPNSTAVFNLFLVIFTGFLALGGFYQLDILTRAERIAANTAQAAKDSADIARQTLEATQRAFVFVNSFETSAFTNLFQISPKYENSGSTPTQNMHAWISWKTFAGEPPVDFDYPDIDPNGNIDTTPKTQPAFVGPKATSYGGVIFIPVTEIAKIKDRTARIFIWGWIEYDDISPTAPRHRTQFCNELVVVTVAVITPPGTPTPTPAPVPTPAPAPAPIEGAPVTSTPEAATTSPAQPHQAELGLRFNLYGPFNTAK